MANIIFLDVDGVLNGRGYYKSIAYKRNVKKTGYDMSNQICRKNLFWVGILCKLTKSQVVLSSTWKFGWNEDGTVKKRKGSEMWDTDKLFRKFGVNIISITPRGEIYLKNQHEINKDKLNKLCSREAFQGLEETRDKDFVIKYCRGTQILKWIEENNFAGNFIIIEDDYQDVEIYTELEKRIVITKFYGRGFGFRLKHLIKALKLFSYKRT